MNRAYSESSLLKSHARLQDTAEQGSDPIQWRTRVPDSPVSAMMRRKSVATKKSNYTMTSSPYSVDRSRASAPVELTKCDVLPTESGTPTDGSLLQRLGTLTTLLGKKNKDQRNMQLLVSGLLRQVDLSRYAFAEAGEGDYKLIRKVLVGLFSIVERERQYGTPQNMHYHTSDGFGNTVRSSHTVPPAPSFLSSSSCPARPPHFEVLPALTDGKLLVLARCCYILMLMLSDAFIEQLLPLPGNTVALAKLLLFDALPQCHV